ncbi:MAG: sensor domain-containing phosphodiesterase [Oleiphilaceae bacterium]|nr:sensor domain-containing phosphodiesterase [Oleiphilaceae bacterium]
MTTAEERTRLEELLSLNILDTSREERFDRHTRLASKVFDTPIAIVTLIDQHRAWFKSTSGTDAQQVRREESICNHALGMGYLEIQDTFADKIFQNHPATKGHPPLRFYAGAVLYGPAGQALGTLCLIDHVPRRLSPSERALLEAFARLVEDEIVRDFELEKARRRVQSVTLGDSSTGLLGETLLSDTLEQLIRVSDPKKGNLAIMHLWIENLDTIVRLHGIGAQDTIVQTLAKRLTAYDQHHPIFTAARVAPDRFVIITPIDSSRSALDEALRIQNKLAEPVMIDELLLRAETSIGVSTWPRDGSRADELLGRARRALNDRHATDGVHLFSRDEDAWAIRRYLMEQRLENALIENQLTLEYQPIFAADGSRIASFEALIRWRDEELGGVDPKELVAIADRTERLSRSLTEWVIRSACLQARTWHPGMGTDPIRVAVNIPAREFHDPGFLNRLDEILQQTGMDPNRLTLELTEESLILDPEQIIRTMEILSRQGIKLALDDFGTGYSSLSYLRRLPVHILKIDKSFIDGLPDQQGAIDLVAGIIGIARGMGLAVVAEGVEHEAQRALLAELHCDMIQGFLLGRPMTDSEVTNLVEGTQAV